MSSSSSHQDGTECPVLASATTRMTTGASLKPDSASSSPPSRGGSGTLRSTENTAAESVGASTAAMSSASCHPTSSSRCAATPTTPTDTAVPIVASDAAAGTAERIPSQGVVRPPSARITTSAA